MEDAIDPNGLTVKAERPDEVKPAERQEEQLKAMQVEDEEDPGQAWAWTELEKSRQANPRTWKARRKMQSTHRRSGTNCGISGSTSMKTPTGNLCSQFFCFGNN